MGSTDRREHDQAGAAPRTRADGRDGRGTSARRTVVAAAALVLVAGVAPLSSDGGAGFAMAAATAAMPFDFDGDGYADVPVGVTGEDVDGATDAGAVQVLYGSASGPTGRDQFWHQGQPGMQDAAEEGDWFGASLTSGDFDADGYADLAIGVPGEDVGPVQDAGAVQVIYGGPGGLTTRNQFWNQDTPGVPGAGEFQDWFGVSLAAGDFDADGYADLAIGVPDEDVGDIGESGLVVVLSGSSSGLTSDGVATFRQGAGGVTNRPAPYDGFGRLLAAADVTGDGRDDLVVGTRVRRLCQRYGECPPSFYLLRGGPDGLTGSRSQFIDGEGELGLGYAGGGGAPLGDLTLSDFNGDGYADLAFAGQESYVALLHGHSDGFHPARLRPPGVPGRDAVWKIPGWAEDANGALTSGDVTGDGNPDLFVQVDDPVLLFPGTAAGLSGAIIQWPLYSYANMVALPLSGGTHTWLIASTSAPGLPAGAGAITVLQGTPNGAPGPATIWHQDSPGIEDTAEEWDNFGALP